MLDTINHTTSFNPVRRITLNAVYRTYSGYVLKTNTTTNRARIFIWDDVLAGGCYRVLTVDANRVEVRHD